MLLLSKIKYAAIAAFLLLFWLKSNAEPYLAFKTNNKCSACHVNPIGGGARNTYGNVYGNQILPANISTSKIFDPGNIHKTLRVGANLRANLNRSDQQNSEIAQGFETQSAQIYLHFKPDSSRFSFYLDQQVAPGAALSREAYVLAKLKGQHYLKFGKIMLPYGIRLEDDSAFIRQATQINFDNNDNGVELGLEYAKTTFNFVVSNGSGGATNDDDAFQFIGRGEYIGNNWRLGASTLLNDSELGERTMFGLFAGLNVFGFTTLFEVDHIRDASIINAFGDDSEQLVWFVEVNRELSKGLNLKLTYESLDPDVNIDENERTRSSALLEYTPFSNFQLRGGVRIGDDIPQRDQGNFTDVFLQAHLYF